MKRIIAFILALIMIMNVNTILVKTNAAGTLSLTSVGTSSVLASYFGALAVDGIIDTTNINMWHSASNVTVGTTEWIKIQLGYAESYQITEVKLYMHTGRPVAVQNDIYIYASTASSSDADFTLVKTVKGTQTAIETIVLDSTVTAKYIKIASRGDKATGESFFTMREVQVKQYDPALSLTATATSSVYSGYVGMNAVDGIIDSTNTNMWHSIANKVVGTEEWIKIKLGDSPSYDVTQLLLYVNTGRTVAIENDINIYASLSGSLDADFTLVKSVKGTRSAMETITFATTMKAKYIKIASRGDAATGDSFFTLREVQVAGAPSPGTVSVTSMSLDTNEKALGVTAAFTLTANIEPANATNKTVIWSSSNDLIASVDQNGVVTANAEGNAVITATTQDGGFFDTCSITSVGLITSNINNFDTSEAPYISGNDFTVSHETSIPLSGTGSLKYTIGTTTGWNYMRTNGSLVTVPSGYTGIMFRMKTDANAGAIFKVQIVNTWNDIGGTGTVLTDNNGNVLSGTAAGTPDDNWKAWKLPDDFDGYIFIPFSSANNPVTAGSSITINFARVSGFDNTTTYIDDLRFYKTNYYSVAVYEISHKVNVTDITLDKTIVSCAPAETFNLSATILPVDATNQNVTWSSSDENIATVSNTGLVTAVSEGYARITIVSQDGNYTAICDVAVINPNPPVTFDNYIVTNKNLSNINPGTTESNFRSGLSKSAEAELVLGNLAETNKIRTGTTVDVFVNSTKVDSYKTVIYGDINGDSYISIPDLTLMKQYLLKISTLTDEYLSAGKINSQQSVSVSDLLALKKHLIGTSYISQNVIRNGLQYKSAKFDMSFDKTGIPTALTLSDGLQILNTSASDKGFSITIPNSATILLNKIFFENGNIKFCSQDLQYAATIKINQSPWYTSFTLIDFEGVLPMNSALTFNLSVSAPIDGFSFDYTTTDRSSTNNIKFTFDRIWEKDPSNPLGGFALYYSTFPDEQDDAILHIWGNEAVPHPNVGGTWSYTAAKQWVDDWCNDFADQSVMYITGNSVDELKQFEPYLDMADTKMVYLFTNTWQNSGFWPTNNLNWQVGPGGIFHNEAALTDYSSYLGLQNRTLNFHYVSGGLGLNDPQYAGANLSDQLANWVDGTFVSYYNSTNIIFRPAKDWYVIPSNTIGQVNDPNYNQLIGKLCEPLGNSSVFPYNYLQINKELMKITSVTAVGDGTWKIGISNRGLNSTSISTHVAGESVKGLIVPYNAVYVPDQNSSLLNTVASQFAGLLNRTNAKSAVFDGAEIHAYDGDWGFDKFSTLVYQNLDHPVITHTSRGHVPYGGFVEYKLNRVKKLDTGPKGDASAGRASLTLERINTTSQQLVPSSQLLAANFMLSTQAALRGENFSILRGDPMFGISLQDFATYGRTNEMLQLLPKWKAVSKKLTDWQCDEIVSTFSRSTENGKYWSDVCYELRESPTQYQLYPMQLMARENVTELKFRMGQEEGMFPAVQTMNMGSTLNMRNVYGPQTPQFILRNVTGNSSSIENPYIKVGGITLKVNCTLAPSGYIEYRGGATANVYDLNWNLQSTVSVTNSNLTVSNGYNTVEIGSDNNSQVQIGLQLMTQGSPIVVYK